MSSTRDAGYYSEQQSKTMSDYCSKSTNREHSFTKLGTWPSTWYKCVHCGTTTYSK